MVANTIKAAALGGYVSCLYAFISSRRIRKRGVSIAQPLRQNISFVTATAVYTDDEFRSAFRMSREVFQDLLKIVRKDIQKNVEMGRRSRRTTVPPDMRLAITLRILAGGDLWDLLAIYHVKASTIRRAFEDTINSLNKRLKLPGLPRSMEGLHRTALEFKMSRRSPSPFNGCVGALDGLAVKIKKPREENNPAVYYSRKDFYALCVQALVDSNYRFLSYSCRCVGSTHDSLAHAVSSLGRYLEQGELNGEFWIAGDEAYVCTESLITPVPMSQASEVEGAFNFFLSSLRIHVEQAFGMLVAKWAILQRPLQYAVRKNSRIVCVTMKLHNFCSLKGEPKTQGLEKEDFRRVYAESVLWHRKMRRNIRERMRETGQVPARSTGSRKRDELIVIVREKGLERPPVVRTCR